MYETSFGFCKRPFAAAPRVDRYFPAATIEAARQNLVRCIDRAEGAGMVVGPSGAGKTLLCQMLAEAFRDKLQVVLLSSGRMGTRRALLQGILHGLEQPYRDMDEGELRIELADYLSGLGSPAKAVLLLADEAHTLPLRCLDEFRVVTNVVVDGQPQVRLVLAGSTLLEERLAHPRLESFSQRLVARCYLEAMTRTETGAYIHAQISASGGNTSAIFPPQTCDAVYQATGGVPRLVNQVCDHALLLAHGAREKRVDPERVQAAWADLQQLPTPWSGEAVKHRQASKVVEFGALEEEVGKTASEGAAPATVAPPVAAEPPSASGEALTATKPRVVVAEPAEQVEVIQDMLGELEDDFRPAGTIVPEVEIVINEPGGPFDEQFLEEEIVVDRYAAVLAERNVEAVTARMATDATGDPSLKPAAIERPTLPLHSVAAVAELEPEEPEVVIDEDYDFAERAQAHPVTPVRPNEYRRLFAQLRRA